MLIVIIKIRKAWAFIIYMEKEDVTESWTSVIIDYTYYFFAWPWTSYYVFPALC